MKRKMIVGSLIAALAVPVMAFAAVEGEQGKRFHKGDMFERLDSNKDGEITLDEMTARVTARFEKLDSDKTGTVTIEEMTVRVKEMFEKMDTDGNAAISRDEAKAFHQAKRDAHKARHGDRMLKILDADGDGAVSKEEFVAASSMRFAAADKDGDGVLSAAELATMKRGMKKMKDN